MAKSRYSEKLRDPRWQKKRLEVLKRDGWKCQICLDTEETLAVHHRLYEHGKEPWDYPLGWLVTLCEPCHELERENRVLQERLLIRVTRERLFASDVDSLRFGLATMEFLDSPAVVMKAISHALRTPKLQKQILAWHDEARFQQTIANEFKQQAQTAEALSRLRVHCGLSPEDNRPF